MKDKREVTLFVLLFLASFLLSSCNGSAAEAKYSGAVTLEIEGLDTLAFAPASASIPADSEIELTFRNEGNLDHNLMIVASEIDPFDLNEADAMSGINTGVVPRREKTTLSFRSPPAGTYTFVCVVPGHAAAGMSGTLTVFEPVVDDRSAVNLR